MKQQLVSATTMASRTFSSRFVVVLVLLIAATSDVGRLWAVAAAGGDEREGRAAAAGSAPVTYPSEGGDGYDDPRTKFVTSVVIEFITRIAPNATTTPTTPRMANETPTHVETSTGDETWTFPTDFAVDNDHHGSTTTATTTAVPTKTTTAPPTTTRFGSSSSQGSGGTTMVTPRQKMTSTTGTTRTSSSSSSTFSTSSRTEVSLQTPTTRPETTTTATTEKTRVSISQLPGECSDPLGLETGAGKLSASDWSPGFLPNEARFNGRSGWVGGFVDVHFIQVDLERAFSVSAIRLQSHVQWTSHVVQEFRILYSVDGYHWTQIPSSANDGKRAAIATALDNRTRDSIHVLTPPIQARFVAIHPTRWVGHPGPALRFELYGCRSQVGEVTNPRFIKSDIMTDTTWEAGMYVVDHLMHVRPGVKFVLKPGVEVFFTNSMAGILVEGTMVAEGSVNLPVTFTTATILSHLIIGRFWRGIIFNKLGNSVKSTMRHVGVFGAGVGVTSTPNSVNLTHVHFRRCETGFRLENGIQTDADLLADSDFVHNKVGIQVHNVTGDVLIRDVQLRDQKMMGVAGYFVYSTARVNVTNMTLSRVRAENSSYAIHMTGYNNLVLDVVGADVRDCHYGIYLDFSDAVPQLRTTVRHSNFAQNRVYGIVFDFRHFGRDARVYHGDHAFLSRVVNCTFDTGANGVSYFAPEILTGPDSEFAVSECRFRHLHTAAVVQLFERSRFSVERNQFEHNSGRALEVFYNSIGVKGKVSNNSFVHNHRVQATARKTRRDETVRRDYPLISLGGNSDSEMFGIVTFSDNVVTNNTFDRVLETNLLSLDMEFNLFENPAAECELCVSSLWVHGGKTLNATHNWWGVGDLRNASRRVADFYRDMDVAAAVIAPILREPKVVGASWDTETSRQIRPGGSLAEGGVVVGNVSVDKPVDVDGTVYVPAGSELRLLAGARLKFTKNVGIVVEGKLHIVGTKSKPVILENLVSKPWKGVKLVYSQETSLSFVDLVSGRGVDSIGSIPKLESVAVRSSSASGLRLTLIQPPPIVISGLVLQNNTKHGVLIEVQGNGSTPVVVSLSNCHVAGNGETGIQIDGGNVVGNVSISENNVTDNGENGVKVSLSNGQVEVERNEFRSNKSSGKLLNVQFDEMCKDGVQRNVTVTGNTFGETTSTSGSVLVEGGCLNSSSSWTLRQNTFVASGKRTDRSAPDETAAALPDSRTMVQLKLRDGRRQNVSLPLDIDVSNNTFTCHQDGAALDVTADHGETVRVEGNRVNGCDVNIRAEGRVPHAVDISSNTFAAFGTVTLRSRIANGTANGTTGTGIRSTEYSSLNFSHNDLSGGHAENVLITSGYDASVHYNFFRNPKAAHDLNVGDTAPVNATLNWWGTNDFNRVLSRVMDGRVEYGRAEAAVFPCLLSRNYSDVSTANPDVFSMADGKIGGTVNGNVTLPRGTYDVRFPIRIPLGSSLTLLGKTTLNFWNNTGIYAIGELIIKANDTDMVDMKPANGTTSWRGVQVGKPRKEFVKVRLSGSQLSFTGRVEVLTGGKWKEVCADGFTQASAHVVCKELSYEDAESFTTMSSPQGSFGLSEVKCSGMEMSLLDCRGRRETKCESMKTPVVVCKQEPTKKQRRRRAIKPDDHEATVFKFLTIDGAEVGLQISDDGGVELDHVRVTRSSGPGLVLSSASPIRVASSVVSDGNDVGINVVGSSSFALASTNVTRNNRTGLSVVLDRGDVTLSSSNISDNGVEGAAVTTKGDANVTECRMRRNGQVGLRLAANEVAFNRTVVEEHPSHAVEINASRLSITNCAFVDNGGVLVALMAAANGNNNNNNNNNNNSKNGSKAATASILIDKTGFINSSMNSSSSSVEEKYAAHFEIVGSPTPSSAVTNGTAKATANGAANGTAKGTANGTAKGTTTLVVPIRVSDCHVLDSAGDGLSISSRGGEISLEVVSSRFDGIGGNAVRVKTRISPQLEFKRNTFAHVKNETLSVEVTDKQK